MLNTRRSFLGSCIGLGALAGCKALNIPGASLGGKAKLKLGVLSDVHIREMDNPDWDTRWIVKAFEYFRDNGADGVIIAGDIADQGRIHQLQNAADAWFKVFPNDTAPDGRHVEKLFVYGNHDVQGWTWGVKKEDQSKPEVLADSIGCSEESIAKTWEKCFKEKYEPIWIKDVKGYKVIGAHWDCWGNGKLEAFVKAHDAELRGSKPFFYTQHAHPKDTCFGKWSWGADGGESTAVLSKYPNAFAFSGHSHYTLVDERTVWQGSFTSINTSSMRYSSHDYNLRDTANFGGNGWGYRHWPRGHVSPAIDTYNGHQGMLVEVGDCEIVIHRRDFTWGESLGDDWVLPLRTTDGTPYDPAMRLQTREAPQFKADAKLAISYRQDEKHGEVLDVTIPHAETVAKCRVFEYEVTAVLLEDDVDLVASQKRVIAQGFNLPESKCSLNTICSFKKDELPPSAHVRFEVCPIECFGKKGAKIVSSGEIVFPAKKD